MSRSKVGLVLSCVLFLIILWRTTPEISTRRVASLGLDFTVHAPPNSLYNAWEMRNESCVAWIANQVANRAYLDAYVVGSQKAGTTQLTHMLERLKVRRSNMIKEWHFYNHLTADGVIKFGRFETDPLPSLRNLTHLRVMHYRLGFPSLDVTALPRLDTGPIDQRTIVLDSTVEYLHMERAALLASMLTSHARIIIMIRDPPSRALSQYNMYTRDGNKKLRAQGLPDQLSLPDFFDQKVRDEIQVLRECGYDDKTATLQGNTTQLIRCMRKRRPRIDDVMYVMRGLYFLHIEQWRKHFADSQLLFVPFSDIVRGYASTYQRIARFLCVRPFTDELMASVDTGGSDLSYGQQAARDGLLENGADTYRGNDRYLSNMWPSTRVLLDDFYASANEKLEGMLGRPMY